MPLSKRTRSLLILLLLPLRGYSTTEKKCYYPDGGEIPASESHVPCNPTSDGHSACCRTDALCLTNGLCFQQDHWGNRLGRCGCTDGSWTDGSCASICEDVGRDGGLSIFLAQPQSSRGKFCCGGMYNGSSCPSATKGSYEPIDIPRGLVYFPNTSNTLGEYRDIVESNMASAKDSTTNDTPASCTASVRQSGSQSASVGLGVSLGTALLIVIGILVWQRRQMNRLQKELDERRVNQGRLIEGKPMSGVLPYEGSSQELSAKESSRESELPFENMVMEMPQTRDLQELDAGQR